MDHSRDESYELGVSPYEQVASLLISLLILVGSAVVILFALWLTTKVFPKQVAVPITFEPIGDDGGLGDNMELDPNVTVPGIETEFEEPELKDVLAAISDAVANKAAILADPMLLDNVEQGVGGPVGDGRAPGHGRGRPGRPRHWEVQFLEGNTLETYAQQLDYFKIELGALQTGNRVDYAYNLSKSRPDRRSGAADAEQRYYLTWRTGELQKVDRELLGRAGINTEGRLVLKFLPPEVERQLATLEQQKAGDDAKKVRATYFGIRRRGSGYEFYVVDQAY